MIDKRVKLFIEENRLIKSNDTIIIGLSGGKDSVLMTMLLNELREEYQLRLIACHLNHELRGEDAVRDQLFSENLCKKMGITFITKNESVYEYAKKHKISTEDAGRKLRYHFFNEIANKYEDSKIATAHHLNDSVETFLLNLFRGAGISGLTGIDVKNGNIIRPLMCLTRDEIDQYFENRPIQYVEDRTNLINDYDRNRIRNTILPYIKKNFNSNIINTLDRTMKIIQKEDEALDKYTNECRGQCINNNKLYIACFKKLPTAIQRRMIRLWVIKLRGTMKDLSYHDVENLISLVDKRQSKKYIFKDFVFEKVYDDIVASHISNNNVEDNPIPFRLGVQYFKDYIITAKLMDSFDLPEKPLKGQYFFDASILNEILVIRTRLDGDRIIQFNNKSKKVKEIFINHKIPRLQRNNIPIISGDEIYLVGNVKRSNKYLVQGNSEKILLVEINKIE